MGERKLLHLCSGDEMIYIPYTGVGARKLDPKKIQLVNRLGKRLDELGLTLRSGGAKGTDSEFERPVRRSKEIFRPADYTGRLPFGHKIVKGEMRERAIEIVAPTHPAWNKLPDYVKELHIRNVFQVIGEQLNHPSLFLLCWTEDGADGINKLTSTDTGGTGTAIRIANIYGVPVINLNRENSITELDKILRFAGII